MSKSLIISLAAAAAALCAAPALAQDATIQPGYWQVTNRVSAIISKTTHENRCITPAQVDKFMSGPSNSHYQCVYPIRNVAGGRMSFRGSCVDKYGKRADVVASGAYSPTTFQLDAHVAASYAGLPIKARFTTEARRVGDVCPPGAKS